MKKGLSIIISIIIVGILVFIGFKWLTNNNDTQNNINSSEYQATRTDSNNKISRSALTFGTSTTTYLTNKGTWATPSGDHKVT